MSRPIGLVQLESSGVRQCLGRTKTRMVEERMTGSAELDKSEESL